MRVTALFGVIVSLLGGASVAQAQDTMSKAQFREARQEIVVQVNKARFNRCRYDISPRRSPGEINSFTWNLDWWGDRLARQRQKFSKCIPYPQRKIAGTWRNWNKPSTYSNWMCIHSYEGSWTDPNSPYYGGLQMNSGFMGTYGWRLLKFKGTADYWAPMEQIWVAEHARTTGGRGFYPWPLTARYCGLI